MSTVNGCPLASLCSWFMKPNGFGSMLISDLVWKCVIFMLLLLIPSLCFTVSHTMRGIFMTFANVLDSLNIVGCYCIVICYKAVSVNMYYVVKL